ncbi:hypothetical protein [Sphingobacterium faecale]|uniref:Uncharacterized protein n=1 Tax=Sphingobacterium faecale TaxID=2803775 RepID=A0ABS1R8N3_9SPHI|nr:hypothetical protein [Sphingobacterium faecale]MBL1411038.1 hypothetical protein [Sphingobacterium faecale]
MKLKKIKFALLAIACMAALSGVIMILWNLLIPEIFGLTTLNFWQALGLFALTRLLFGRFGGGRGKGCRPGFGSMKRGAMAEKWAKMTAEERKEFICKRRKFGFGDPFGADHFDTAQDDGARKED